jgi:hypothetical protein
MRRSQRNAPTVARRLPPTTPSGSLMAMTIAPAVIPLALAVMRTWRMMTTSGPTVIAVAIMSAKSAAGGVLVVRSTYVKAVPTMETMASARSSNP